MFAKLKIGQKLALSFAIVVVIGLISSFTTRSMLHRVSPILRELLAMWSMLLMTSCITAAPCAATLDACTAS